MPFASDDASHRARCPAPAVPTVPSLLILGTDAVLAAAPSSAVQLTHACLAAGFDAVIPASWGDELIAARVLERLERADAPLVECSCPLVANRLAAHADAIAPMVLCLVSPPVATASYLRALYAPARPRITYVGACPSAGADVIDVWQSPDDLLGMLAARGVSVAAQPREFDAMLAPDRRRFHSDPGGVPAPVALRALHAPVECVEVSADSFVTELAQHLLESNRILIDASGAMGCPCSGAPSGPESVRSARARVREHEPPRAPGPVLDESVRVVLDAELPVVIAAAPERRRSLPNTSAMEPKTDPVPVATEAPRRRSPTGTRKSILGGMPLARLEVGRQLPRAYVARRRSSPKGVQAQRTSAIGSRRPGRRWPYIAAAGVGIGVVLAWLMGLAR